MRSHFLMLMTAVMVLATNQGAAYTLPTGTDALVKWANSCQDYTGKPWCNLETARSLLKGGADPNAPDQFGVPALHRVIDYGLDVAIVRAIIDGGARVNQKDKLGSAPLHHLRYWNPEALQALLKAGADVNAQDGAGYTALMYAVGSEDRVPYVKALLAAGANASLKGKSGETALSIAEKSLAEHRKSAAEPGQPSGIVEANKAIIAQYEDIVRLLKTSGSVKGGSPAGATAGTANGSGASASSTGLVFRPKCNVRVVAFDAPKQSVVPIGTVLYKCPDRRAGVEGKLVAEGYFKLVGEYGDWYEYEGKAGRIGYFRKTGVTMRVAPESTVAGADASKSSTSRSAAAGSAQVFDGQGSRSNDLAMNSVVGIWRWQEVDSPDSLPTFWKIAQAGPDGFKLTQGSPNSADPVDASDISWFEGTDGVYLKAVEGQLEAEFQAANFLASTHGIVVSNRVKIQPKSRDRLSCLVWSNVSRKFVEYEARRLGEP